MTDKSVILEWEVVKQERHTIKTSSPKIEYALEHMFGAFPITLNYDKYTLGALSALSFFYPVEMKQLTFALTNNIKIKVDCINSPLIKEELIDEE